MAAADNEPMAYLSGEEASGMCIELVYLIARDMGYGLEIGTNNVGSLIADVQSGKADIAAANFSITEERQKMVDMTEPFYDGGVVAVVRTATPSANADQGFFEGVAASFERTFITEDRWHMILTGLGVTLLMTLVSGLLGLALGFLLVLRRGGNRVAESIIGGFEGLMGGLPVVVVLMVFYYIVFGAIDMPGVIVAIIVFTLLFAASSGSIMWNAIKAVDPGQTEAGRAIGFSDRETFFLVVLPQAASDLRPPPRVREEAANCSDGESPRCKEAEHGHAGASGGRADGGNRRARRQPRDVRAQPRARLHAQQEAAAGPRWLPPGAPPPVRASDSRMRRLEGMAGEIGDAGPQLGMGLDPLLELALLLDSALAAVDVVVQRLLGGLLPEL